MTSPNNHWSETENDSVKSKTVTDADKIQCGVNILKVLLLACALSVSNVPLVVISPVNLDAINIILLITIRGM